MPITIVTGPPGAGNTTVLSPRGCPVRVSYSEGIFVGYRYYQEHDQQPLLPLGFGLYTRFAITNVGLSRVGSDTVTVRATV